MSNYEWIRGGRLLRRMHDILTTYSSSSVSWATSGTVIVPVTSSASGAEPVLD